MIIEQMFPVLFYMFWEKDYYTFYHVLQKTVSFTVTVVCIKNVEQELFNYI